MNKSSYLFNFVVVIVVGIAYFTFHSSVSAQLGMPKPQCDETLSPNSYFEKYINSTNFKALHPTYDQWQRLPDDYKNREVCINKNQKALLLWNFALPTSLSRLQIGYKYQVALVVNSDKSAQIAIRMTPEGLIRKVESLPEVNEYINKFSNELIQSTKWNSWIGSSTIGESSGYTSPLQVNYTADKIGYLSVSSEGVDSADLSIHQDWQNFPTVKIGFDLAKQALKSTNCTLDESPTAVSRYSPHSQKNDNESEKFIYNSYNILCPNNEFRYSMINIYPDGRFTVWLENKKQILSGQIQTSDLDKIQAVIKKSNNVTPSQKTLTDSQAIVQSSPERQTILKNIPLILVAAATFLCLLVVFTYLLIVKQKRKTNLPPDHEETPLVSAQNIDQT